MQRVHVNTPAHRVARRSQPAAPAQYVQTKAPRHSVCSPAPTSGHGYRIASTGLPQQGYVFPTASPQSGVRAVSPGPLGTQSFRAVSPVPLGTQSFRAVSPVPLGTQSFRAVSPVPRVTQSFRAVSPVTLGTFTQSPSHLSPQPITRAPTDNLTAKPWFSWDSAPQVTPRKFGGSLCLPTLLASDRAEKYPVVPAIVPQEHQEQSYAYLANTAPQPISPLEASIKEHTAITNEVADYGSFSLYQQQAAINAGATNEKADCGSFSLYQQQAAINAGATNEAADYGSVSQYQQQATNNAGAVKGKEQRKASKYTHGVRTAIDGSTTAERALEKLKEGNQRFVEGQLAQRQFQLNHREALANYGQRPMATVIGCADSRCSTDTIFDAHPGDLFVLRNAGNTLTQAEGSMVGSTEYSVCHLGVNLIVILGHTHCGAIAGATKCMIERKTNQTGPSGKRTTLSHLLAALEPVAEQAQFELQEDAGLEQISAHAVYVNVFNSVEKLLSYSKPLREKCQEGTLQIHGAVYDIVSGGVEFLGEHPRLPLLLGSQSALMNRSKDYSDQTKKDRP